MPVEGGVQDCKRMSKIAMGADEMVRPRMILNRPKIQDRRDVT